MSDADYLSDLPDDLLRRILHLVPAKEGASTTALARRWRSIWPSSGAVNLDSRSYDLNRYHKRDVIMRHAQRALAAAHGHGCPVRKFTFRYEEGEDDPLDSVVNDSGCYEDYVWAAERAMARELNALLHSRVACLVEELRLGLLYGPRGVDGRPTGMFDLNISALSCSRALRVLHVRQCMDWNWDYATCWRRLYMIPPFPQLVELRLHECSVSLGTLQGVIDGAPHLATLHLDGVEPKLSSPTYPPTASSFSLRCPKIIDLVLANMRFWSYQCQNIMEVDAPMLRRFTYEGPIRPLSLKSSPPGVERVDLRFHVPAQVHTEDGRCRLFWKLVRNLGYANTINFSFQLSEKA